MTESLGQRIEQFLRTGTGDFESVALELFAYQFARNKPYQAFCRAQGLSPVRIQTWQEIPAVPVSAFKSSELATFPVAQAAAVFRSSGTTSSSRSQHYLRTLRYYESSLESFFSSQVLPDQARLPMLVLAPAPAEAPHSSLSWMLEVVKRKFGTPGSGTFIERGVLLETQLFRKLCESESTGVPVALLGTTISFLKFFDYLSKTGKIFRLPPGSRLMDTGGMKTEKRQVTRPEFVQQVTVSLGIPEEACINEYGMCELSSQFYGRGGTSSLQGPPWTRTIVVDSVTGGLAKEGETGLLRHFDLANVDSVMAVQTEDLGTSVRRSTSDAFHLLGRAPNAEVRGCSLSAEAYRT